jgi:hypothetical protein
VIGVPLTLLTLDLPSRVDLAVMIVTGLLLLAVIGLVVLARRGALATLIHALRRIRLVSAERAERWIKRMAAIDDNVRRFGDATTRRALVFVIASRLLNMAGSIVILVASDIPLTAPLVIGMLSVGILITWLSNVIPLGLGLADGSNYLLYQVLGSSPDAGLDFTMINRVRPCPRVDGAHRHAIANPSIVERGANRGGSRCLNSICSGASSGPRCCTSRCSVRPSAVTVSRYSYSPGTRPSNTNEPSAFVWVSSFVSRAFIVTQLIGAVPMSAGRRISTSIAAFAIGRPAWVTSPASRAFRISSS